MFEKLERDDKAYFARVSKQVAGKQGHLLFRANRPDVCLGSQGIDGGGEDTAAVKWTISRSPACWIDPAEVQQWITQRGFTKVAQG